MFAVKRGRAAGLPRRSYDNGQRHDGPTQTTLPLDPPRPCHTVDAPEGSALAYRRNERRTDGCACGCRRGEQFLDAIIHITTRQGRARLHHVHMGRCVGHDASAGFVGIFTSKRPAAMPRATSPARRFRRASLRSVRYAERPPPRLWLNKFARSPDNQEWPVLKIALAARIQALAGPDEHLRLRLSSPRPGRSTGVTHRGFEVSVGGGPGAVPHACEVVRCRPVPEVRKSPPAQAACCVFSRASAKRTAAEQAHTLVEKTLRGVPPPGCFLEELQPPRPDPRAGPSTSIVERHRDLARPASTSMRHRA